MMKFYHRFALALAGITIAYAGLAMPASTSSNPTPEPNQPVMEQEGEWLAAHESSGPEGDQGVAMGRLPPMQIGLAALVLAAGAGLALLPHGRQVRSNHLRRE